MGNARLKVPFGGREPQRTGNAITPVPRDLSLAGMTSGGLDTVWGIASTGRTPRKMLELASRIGSKSWSVLIYFGSTSNYISVDGCTINNVEIEEDPYPDQLTMADGSQVETTG